jgi:four helix bundle protein
MRVTEELRKRTKQYASAVIRLYVTLPVSRKEVQVLGHQLLRSGTSVAAHSRGSKLDAALQEADESALWIELLQDDCGISTEELSYLMAETDELISIL